MAEFRDPEFETALREFRKRESELEPMRRRLAALKDEMKPLEKEQRALLARIDEAISEFDGYASKYYEAKDLVLRVSRKASTRESPKYKELFEFLYDKVNPALKKAADEQRSALTSISRTLPKVTVEPRESALGNLWKRIKSAVGRLLRGFRRGGRALDELVERFGSLAAESADRRRTVDELEALAASDDGKETQVARARIDEKIDSAQVLGRAEFGDFGVVLWRNEKASDLVEFGTHEYRVDNPDAWYTGHYFSAYGDTTEAEAKKSAQEDFDERAARLSARSRREARDVKGKKRVGEKKGPESRAAKGVDPTKVDKEIGKAGDSPDDPKKHLGNPDKPKAPKVKKDKEPASTFPSEPRTKWWAATIDGKEIERVRAKNKKEAKDELTKSMMVSKTRREFLRQWIDSGSKIVPADGDKAVGYEKVGEPFPESSTVEVDCGSRRGALLAKKVLDGSDAVEAVGITEEGNTVNVDVQAGQDDALKLVLDILGDEGFDLDSEPLPVEEPLEPEEPEVDVAADDDFEGFEGKVRGARVVDEGEEEFVVVDRVEAFLARANEELVFESANGHELYEKLLSLSEELDEIIDRYYEQR